jgi:hypothetical protein
LALSVLAILNRQATLPVLIVFVLCLALVAVIAHILTDRTRRQRVAMLDAIAGIENDQRLREPYD